MHKCPKCSSQYGDDLKICRTCGAILDAVAEESPQTMENDPHDAISAERPSWTCSQCGKLVPGSFEVCWNCGTSKDGVSDPEFSKEPGDDNDRTWLHGARERATAKQLVQPCPRCGSSKIIPNTRILDQTHYSGGILQVAVDADPDAVIFKDRLYDQVTADICGECGHVELKVEHARELYEHYLRSKDGPGA
jgi:hypothetical protein